MSTFSSAPPVAQDASRQSWTGSLADVLRDCWVAYMNWRLERLAISHLQSLSDRELKDIGVLRPQIDRAVRGEIQRDHVRGIYY